MNRLLRSEVFNKKSHQGRNIFRSTEGEDRVLLGTADHPERKLLQRSPVAKELIFSNHDYRMLMIGFLEAAPYNPN